MEPFKNAETEIAIIEKELTNQVLLIQNLGKRLKYFIISVIAYSVLMTILLVYFIAYVVTNIPVIMNLIYRY